MYRINVVVSIGIFPRFSTWEVIINDAIQLLAYRWEIKIEIKRFY